MLVAPEHERRSGAGEVTKVLAGRIGATLIDMTDASLMAFEISLTDAMRTSTAALSAVGSGGSEAALTRFVDLGRVAV